VKLRPRSKPVAEGPVEQVAYLAMQSADNLLSQQQSL